MTNNLRNDLLRLYPKMPKAILNALVMRYQYAEIRSLDAIVLAEARHKLTGYNKLVNANYRAGYNDSRNEFNQEAERIISRWQ